MAHAGRSDSGPLRAIALMVSFLCLSMSLFACGRTGLLVPDVIVDADVTDVDVAPSCGTTTVWTTHTTAAPCQCGLCRMAQFCIHNSAMRPALVGYACGWETNDHHLCGTTRGECPPNTPLSTPIGVLAQDGTSQTIECADPPDTCDGQVALATQHGLLPAAQSGQSFIYPGGINASSATPVAGMCFLNGAYWERAEDHGGPGDAGVRVWQNRRGSSGTGPDYDEDIVANSSAWCGGGNGGHANAVYSCYLPMGSQHSPTSPQVDLSLASELWCPKEEVDGVTEQCGFDDTDGYRRVGAYCALWTGDNRVFDVPGDGHYHYLGSVPGEDIMPGMTCFPRLQTSTHGCLNEDAGQGFPRRLCNPCTRDPGVDVESDLYNIVEGNDSRVEVTAGGSTTPYQVTGNASIESRPGDSGEGLPATLVISDITASVPTAPLINTAIVLDQVWRATQTATPSVYNLDSSTVTATVSGWDSSNHEYGRELVALASPIPTITVSGGDLFIYARTINAFESQTIDVYLRLHRQNVGPSAAITSVTPFVLTQECTGPTGVSFTFTGSASTLSTQWAVSGAPAGGAIGIPSMSVQIPVSLANEPSHLVTYSAFANSRTASETRAVRVIDTTPPTNGSPSFSFDCGWDNNPGEPNPQPPSLCMRALSGGTDTCDAAPIMMVDDARAYDPSGNLVKQIQGNPCLSAPSGYLNAAVSGLTWEMSWHMADHSGNNSSEVFTAFQVLEDSSSGCTVHHANILYIGPVPIQASGRYQIYEFGAVPAGGASIWPGLAFSRASVATVQTGVSTMDTSIGSNVPRVGDDGYNHHGLVFEEPPHQSDHDLPRDVRQWLVHRLPGDDHATLCTGTRQRAERHPQPGFTRPLLKLVLRRTAGRRYLRSFRVGAPGLGERYLPADQSRRVRCKSHGVDWHELAARGSREHVLVRRFCLAGSRRRVLRRSAVVSARQCHRPVPIRSRIVRYRAHNHHRRDCDARRGVVVHCNRLFGVGGWSAFARVPAPAERRTSELSGVG